MYYVGPAVYVRTYQLLNTEERIKDLRNIK